MNLARGPLTVPIVLRYSDVDERRVVNNAKYLTYFEEARIALLQSLEAEAYAELQGRLIIAHAEIDYPLVLGDTPSCEVGLSKLGRTSFDLCYTLRRRDAVVARGRTVQVHFDYDSRRTLPLSERVRAALGAFQVS